MSAKPHTIPTFSGTYGHALDNKNRITIPARWRQTDADEFFIMPDPKKTFLIVMPPEEFNAVTAKVAASPNIPPPDLRIFIREFHSKAQHCVADKQGRLLLPEEHCKQIGLEKDVVILGTDKRFEIWNPKRRQESSADAEATFGRIADEVGL